MGRTKFSNTRKFESIINNTFFFERIYSTTYSLRFERVFLGESIEDSCGQDYSLDFVTSSEKKIDLSN